MGNKLSAPPEELLKLMGSGGGAPGGVASPGGAGAPSPSAPAGGPMCAPQPKEGMAQAAMVNISMVFQLLEQSLPAFGSQSEEGKSILQALSTLTKKFGASRQKSDSLVPAELLQLVQSIPGAGGGSPAQKGMSGIPPSQPAVAQPQAA